MNPLILLPFVLLPALASTPQDQVKSPPGNVLTRATTEIDQPPARDTLRRIGTELLEGTRPNAQSRAIATGWLDSLSIAPPPLSERLAEFDDLPTWKAYLNARFEAESLTGRFLSPIVAEAASTVPANWDRACELKIAIEGVLKLPASQVEGCLDLDPLFRLGPTHAPIIDRLAEVIDCRGLAKIFDGADAVTRPTIAAAILHSGRCPDLRTRILDTTSQNLDFETALLIELTDRSSGDALLALLARRPEVLGRVGIRAAAAQGLARSGRLDETMELLMGEEGLNSLPANSSAGIRVNMVVAAVESGDRASAIAVAKKINRGDMQILVRLVLDDDRGGPNGDPAKTMEGLNSLRLVRPMQWKEFLLHQPQLRTSVVRVLADLVKSQRSALAMMLLTPNDMAPNTGGDLWFEDRIGLLSDALAMAKAPADTWIPLIEAVARLRTPAAQAEALTGIGRGLDLAYPGEPLPPSVRRALDQTLIKITLKG
ncbi:MAG: hypothetical protein OSA40_07755 [Phycisphaerales bacterium]|nr:hypothetical protein [Phycisphaerales bacterium]